MGLKDDLEKEVKKIFGDTWTSRKGTVVPTTDDIGLGNDGVELDAAVLYADLTDSTSLVSGYSQEFAAEIYKCYLRCAAKIIRAEGGSITSFDGDRIISGVCRLTLDYAHDGHSSCEDRAALTER